MNNYSVFTGETKMYKKFSLFSLLMISISISLSAYEPYGSHTSDKWQIWAYSTAAPSFLGDKATIIGSSGKVIREGTNGWTCQAGNPRSVPAKGWKSAHDAMPACFDAEGAKWMAAFMKNEKPALSRYTFMWMLHGDVGEDNTTPLVMSKEDSTPGEWIESGPHLMLIPKDASEVASFTDDFMHGEPYVMMRDTDYAHIMIPTEGYYKYTK